MPDCLRLEAGNLQDALFARGVEFPCGGASLCGGCRVRLVSGEIPINAEMREVLTPVELAAGWRLACRATAAGPVTLEVGQWETPVLADSSAVAVEPRSGFGVAIDVGTTTLAAQFVDLTTGEVLEVATGLNPQGRHGADLMTRVEFDLREPGILTNLIRGELESMVRRVAAGRDLVEVLLAGNSVMHHLFCGLSVEPFAAVPFETSGGGAQTLDLGWGAPLTFLPCLGSFVGSDILAGMVAVDLQPGQALIDLGTNGEIVLGHAQGFLCTSTAAGPAFEAGRIRMGMRAAPGAIDRVGHDGSVHVLGGIAARGICGSGLVDAAALGLDQGKIQASGRCQPWTLDGTVTIYQSDIRELQLAKGAVAAGLRMLEEEAQPASRIYLAGAFGNYVSVTSARRIGLLPGMVADIVPEGNTALRGTRMLLLSPARRERAIARLLAQTRHVSLASDAEFQDRFAEAMVFPG